MKIPAIMIMLAFLLPPVIAQTDNLSEDVVTDQTVIDYHLNRPKIERTTRLSI